MPAQHKSTVYKPLDLPNPFREGQDRAYADILLDKQKEMAWWRGIVGIGVLLLFAASLAFNVYAVRTQKTVPVLVNVMPSGEAQYLGEVRQNAAFQVPEPAIQYQARKFITNLRSVSTDPQVLYNNIDECYAMITASYEPVMTRFLRGASPFDLVGKSRRSVEIESVLKITGSSYQVDWVETVVDSSSTRRNTRMRALVTVKLLPVSDATIRKNPLGVYIENCEMTEL
ncbi:MAG: type IV secretion system protein [Spirochaetaceae bacterium]|jgi:type IV secretion system protein VirB5|nr:type IV secretion system protein [Spirochaetaceae bacterium]